MDRDSLYRIRRWNGFYANTMTEMNKKGTCPNMSKSLFICKRKTYFIFREKAQTHLFSE